MALGAGAVTLPLLLEPADIAIIKTVSRSISVGLLFLWLSGLGFLIYYAAFEPAKLSNPKIYAKLMVVGVLTLNGFLFHALVLPKVCKAAGNYLFSQMTLPEAYSAVAIATVSGVSWFIPFMLGIFPQFNDTVPFLLILFGYCTVLAGGIAVSLLTVPFLFDGFPDGGHRKSAEVPHHPLAVMAA